MSKEVKKFHIDKSELSGILADYLSRKHGLKGNGSIAYTIYEDSDTIEVTATISGG